MRLPVGQSLGIRSQEQHMEFYGLAFSFIWTAFCAFILSWRSGSQRRETPVSPVFIAYLALSVLLGILIVVHNSLFLYLEIGANALSDFVLPVWFIAWQPASLIATFFAPRKYWSLPVLFIFTISAIGVCGPLFINDFDPLLWWTSIIGFTFGLSLIIGAALTFKQTIK